MIVTRCFSAVLLILFAIFGIVHDEAIKDEVDKTNFSSTKPEIININVVDVSPINIPVILIK